MKSDAPKHKKRRIFVGAVLLMTAFFATKAWNDTMIDPQVMRTTVTSGKLSANSDPITVALISDIHVAGPDMPPERLKRIVTQVNALEPDYLFVAGDFISEKRTATQLYTADEAIAPLSGLNSEIRKIAVPGNHDHWFDMPALEVELNKAGFMLLANEAAEIGPFVIGGLDDDFTGRADLEKTILAMNQRDGIKVILSHSPDPFPDLPADYGVMLAGHTHCGQIGYPWGGSPATMSEYGNRYACGRVEENGNVLVTGAGLGTSVLPFRLFSKPEIWLIEFQPAKR